MLAGLLAWPAGVPAAAPETHNASAASLQPDGSGSDICTDPTCCVRLHSDSSLSGKGKLYQFYHFFIDFAPRAWHAVQTVCPKEGVTILAPATEDCEFCLTYPEDETMSMQAWHDFIFGATPVQVITMDPATLESRTDVPLLFDAKYPDFPRGRRTIVTRDPNSWSRIPLDMLDAFRQHLHELAGIAQPCGNGASSSPACEKTVLIQRGKGYGHDHKNATVRPMGRAALVHTQEDDESGVGDCIGACSRSLPRKFYDEAERFLSQRGINYTIAVLETMDTKEQIRLFAEAKLVIGQHGAGLSNIVASSQSTHVIEVGPVAFPCYTFLAENLLQPRVESDCDDFCDAIKDAVDLAYSPPPAAKASPI